MQNFKSKLIVLPLTAILLSGHALLAADVPGERLNIGEGHSLTGTRASIAGGIYNTNAALNATIAGGNYNVVHSNATVSVIAGGDANVIYSSHSTVAGGGLNKILRTNGLPVDPGFDFNAADHGVIAGGYGNILYSALSVISGGNQNMIEPTAFHSVISGGAANLIGFLSGYNTISGGTHNTIKGGAQWAAINGGWHNEIEYLESITTNDAPIAHGGWIGGGEKNYIKGTQGVLGSIGGGYSNVVQGYSSTIAGGYENFAEGNWGVIPGGLQNGIQTNADNCVVGGGAFNIIQSNAYAAVIAGGTQNVVGTNAEMSTISGGQFNKIANNVNFAIIPGGYFNSAEANSSFAAGSYARATNVGAFVWSDYSSGSTFTSTNSNEFAARTHGGVRFETGSGVGVKVKPNEGTWNSLCDRNSKTNFAPVNVRAILDGVALLPIATWSYKGAPESTRHIGPVAQDFYDAFAVGGDDRTIATVDADGVALAAIQALNELMKEKDTALREQQKTVAELWARVRTLEKALSTR
jgi:trimeric autotransporter adhesin